LTFDWSNIDFLSCLENPGVLSHISELHTLLRKLSHTHALHELSLLLKKSCLQKFFAHRLLNSFLYACIFLTSSLTVFTGLNPCVCWFLIDNLTMLFSPILFLVMVLINNRFTRCHCVTKRGSIFWFFFTESVFPNS